jgi:hypothetical protein
MIPKWNTIPQTHVITPKYAKGYQKMCRNSVMVLAVPAIDRLITALLGDADS